MNQRILMEKSNLRNVSMPQPLVSEISVYSPPPTKNTSSKIDDASKKDKISFSTTVDSTNNKPPVGASNRVMAQKTAPAKQINVAKSNFNGKKSETNSDFTELKLQLKQQNSEISELKQLVKQLAAQKLSENTAKSDSSAIQTMSEVVSSRSNENSPKNFPIEKKPAPVYVDVSVQSDGVCPHCEKNLALASPPKHHKRIRVADHLKAAASKTLPEKFPSESSLVTMNEPTIRIDPADLSLLDPETDSFCQPSDSPANQFHPNNTPEHQFIDRMIGAAQKWLKPPSTNAENSSKNVRNGHFQPVNQEPANAYWSLLTKEGENNQGLSMEINSLALRYLNDDRPSRNNINQKWPSSSNRNQKTFGGVGPSSPMGPMAVATRRQTVTMESEVSLVGMVQQQPVYDSSSEMSLSSAEFLRRHGLVQNGSLQSVKYGMQRNNAQWSSNRTAANDYCTSALSTITERSAESTRGSNKMRHGCDCCKVDEFDCESDFRSDFDCRGYKRY